MPERRWHAEDIKSAIRKRGVTLLGLSRASGLCGSNVRNALHRPLISGEIAISSFLGIKPWVLWPERYDADRRKKYRQLVNRNLYRQRGPRKSRVAG